MESNAIEERVELSMLYDFYGALLKRASWMTMVTQR